jgi:hypothetical protein
MSSMIATAQVANPGFDHMVLPTQDTKPQGKYVEHVLTYAV